MTDTAVKTPNKRKSLPKQVSAKKPKLENGNPKTPQQKGNNTNKSLTPKNKSPKGNNVQNSNKKGNKGNHQSKKLKPFVGTTGLTEKKPKGKQNIPKTDSNGEEKKGKRRGLFNELIMEAAEAAKDESKKPAVLQKIDDKISEINSRGELTKTARKKLALLKRCIQIAEGISRPKTVSEVRRERKKNTAANGEDTQVNSNENKKGKQSKQAKQQKEEEASDDDEVEDDESDVEVEEAEDDSGEENSDKEESDEEEIEVPKVSNKKLKLARKK